MSNSFYETETLSPFHNYDEDLSDQEWDLANFEALPEIYEDAEPSPEELVEKPAKFPRAFQDSRRMMVRMSVISGHQSGYAEVPGGFKSTPKTYVGPEKAALLERGGTIPIIDDVDARVEKARQEVSDKAWEDYKQAVKDGHKWPDDPKEVLGLKIDKMPSRGKRPSSLARSIAKMLGAKPEEIHVPRHIKDLPRRAFWEKNERPSAWDLVAQVRIKHAELESEERKKIGFGDLAEYLVNPAEIWNKTVHGLAPVARGAMRHDGTCTIYREPGAPEQPHLCGVRKYRKDQTGAKAAGEWKKLAEEGKVLGRVTRCAVTEESLIQRKIKNGLETWSIGPNIRGMGVKGARMVVELAALKAMPQEVLQEFYGADFVKGTSKNTPEFVQQVVEDPDAWAILAAHTNHPRFGKFARVALAWRDAVYLKLGEAEIREAEQIGAKVAYELKQAYPEEFTEMVGGGSHDQNL